MYTVSFPHLETLNKENKPSLPSVLNKTYEIMYLRFIIYKLNYLVQKITI